MTEFLDAAWQDRLARLESRNGPPADTRGGSKVIEGPAEGGARHAALDDVQFGTRVAKIACTRFAFVALIVP